MRLATFNLENLSDGPQLEERIAVLRPQLIRMDADIVCLQEVDASRTGGSKDRQFSALRQLLNETPLSKFHLVHTHHEDSVGPYDRHNLIVLSRWPIRSSKQYWNTLVPAPRYEPRALPNGSGSLADVRWDRPLLHAEIDLPGSRRLHLINLHLKARLASFIPGQKAGPFAWKTVPAWAEGYFLSALKRNGQALEARLLVDRIFSEEADALIVLAGDFNVEADEAPFRIVLGRTEDTGNGKLAGRELAAPEGALSISRRYTVIHRGQRLMLDHLLVSRSLLSAFRNLEIHNEMLGDELVAYTLIDAAPDSFHAPVVAEFDLNALRHG